MTVRLVIDTEWTPIDHGAPQERASYCALGIRLDNTWLTEAVNNENNSIIKKPHLSAYRFAEWFAWNWWRLRWEPRRHTNDWHLAHKTSSIGGGFIWPNITIFSDGERVALLAKPTKFAPHEPIRYIANNDSFVPAKEFENSIDNFVDLVIDNLNKNGIHNNNLNQIWTNVCEERNDNEQSIYRKLEAILGYDPDEADENTIQQLINDSKQLGEGAIQEIAANKAKGENVCTAIELQDVAKKDGYQTNPSDGVKLYGFNRLPPIGQVPAWVRGARAANMLRSQIGYDVTPISNATLTEMLGVRENIISDHPTNADLSYELDETIYSGHIVLRPKQENGRRFELCRILGDRLAAGQEGGLFPATSAYTYRQQTQRAFAAEFLCPFDAIKVFFQGEPSLERVAESIEEVAKEFAVSEWVIQRHLFNHKYIPREYLGEDMDVDTVCEAAN